MSLVTTIVVGVPATYFGVALAIFILDGYYNWSEGNTENLNFLCWGWPILLLVSPLLIGAHLRDKLIELRKKKEVRIAEETKVRIAAQKELEEIQHLVEQELASEAKKIAAK